MSDAVGVLCVLLSVMMLYVVMQVVVCDVEWGCECVV